MHLNNLLIAILLFGLAACGKGGAGSVNTPIVEALQTSAPSLEPQETSTSVPTPKPPRLLTVCLLHEPRSLFLYDAVSASEQSVLAAIYDGPIDIKNFTAQPVILQKLPSLADGDAVLQPVQVNPKDLVVDAQGNLTNLEDGVLYRPSGCTEQACTQTYSGTEAVQMDQLNLHFKLLPGLQWSDGSPLTAEDSVYSYEVARNLDLPAVPGQVMRTASYKALDDLTVEWTGVPGFVDGLYQAKYFSPLPRHAWAGINTADLPKAEAASRKPLGWGAYVIDDWVPGDHITLHANPLYFRASEGLPAFDNLVYRFVPDSSEAQAAVLAGECDLVDLTSVDTAQSKTLLQQRDEGRISLAFQTAFAWDVLELNVHPLSEDRPAFFARREVRQALAMCINKQAIVDLFSAGQMQIADLYLPQGHPLYNKDVKHYAYDPQAASQLLTASGWLDADNDASTPRIAQGVEGVPAGTAFSVEFLISDDEDSLAASQLIAGDLGKCGIQVNIRPLPIEEYLAAGPEGPVFGRQFDMAQIAWMTAIEPACSLYLTNEIPGPYPNAPKGWGGVNAGGYSNAQYDQACLDALYSLPDAAQHVEKHAAAQGIFAEDLPALPLTWHYRLVMGRPDLCGIPLETQAGGIFTDLESFNYGDSCP